MRYLSLYRQPVPWQFDLDTFNSGVINCTCTIKYFLLCLYVQILYRLFSLFSSFSDVRISSPQKKLTLVHRNINTETLKAGNYSHNIDRYSKYLLSSHYNAKCLACGCFFVTCNLSKHCFRPSTPLFSNSAPKNQKFTPRSTMHFVTPAKKWCQNTPLGCIPISNIPN